MSVQKGERSVLVSCPSMTCPLTHNKNCRFMKMEPQYLLPSPIALTWKGLQHDTEHGGAFKFLVRSRASPAGVSNSQPSLVIFSEHSQVSFLSRDEISAIIFFFLMKN